MKVIEYVVLGLSTLASIRMFLWLFSPIKHSGVAIGLYDQKKVKVKRVVYFLIFLLLSVFLILRGSIVNYMMAFFAIGSLYDFLFTFFEVPNKDQVHFDETIKEGKISLKSPVLNPVRWYIGLPMILLTIWLWVQILIS